MSPKPCPTYNLCGKTSNVSFCCSMKIYKSSNKGCLCLNLGLPAVVRRVHAIDALAMFERPQWQ